MPRFVRLHLCALAACAGVAALAAPWPAYAQGVQCCNVPVDVDGDWFGMLRDCPGVLNEAPQEQRLKACAVIRKFSSDGSVCEEAKPYCPDCDSLAALKAERDKWFQLYLEQRAAADDTRQRASEALEKNQEIFDNYMKDLVTKGVVSVGEGVFPVPHSVYEKFKKYRTVGNAVASGASTEELLELAKLYIEELAKNRGFKDATQRAAWIGTAVSGVQMSAEWLIKLQEFEFHANETFEQWLLAYESLMNARHLEDRIRRLEAECEQAAALASPPHQDDPGDDEDEGWQSSGEREYEEAQRMVEGWRTVDGEIVNTQGSVVTWEQAFEEALAIVQGRDPSDVFVRPQNELLFAALEIAPFLAQAPADDRAGDDAEWQRFRIPMRRGVEAQITSLEAFERAVAAFAALERVDRTAATPQLDPDRVGETAVTPRLDADRPLETAATPQPGADRALETAATPQLDALGPCCSVVPNPDMRGRLGRVVVAFPAKVPGTRVEVFRPGETDAIAAGYGDQVFDLFAGTYDVVISGKRVTGVTVRSGHDTQVRVGVLRVTVGTNMRIEVLEAGTGKTLAGGYGTNVFGLPIGEFGVQVAGQTTTVAIAKAQITEF